MLIFLVLRNVNWFTQVLPCQHLCGGNVDEEQCLPCLKNCAGDAKQDADDICVICFTGRSRGKVGFIGMGNMF